MTREAQGSFTFSPSTEGQCPSIKAACQTVGVVEWSWDQDAERKPGVLMVLLPPAARWMPACNTQERGIGEKLFGFLQKFCLLMSLLEAEMEVGSQRGCKEQF